MEMERHMTDEVTDQTGRAKLLHIYLNDHLAGSAAGEELARRCRDNNRGTPIAAFLDELLQQIEEDRLALEAIMDAVGAPKNPAKLAAAWLGEKLGRLKLNGQLLPYSDLSRLLEQTPPWRHWSAGRPISSRAWRSSGRGQRRQRSSQAGCRSSALTHLNGGSVTA
jgi:hypothetical protein